MNENTLTIGTVLQGKSYSYTIKKVLGQGTFGITYLATTQVKVAGELGELETTMQVAIKEFFMRDINGREENAVTTGSKGGLYANYRQKFAHEAENLSKLHHPNIVKVLEYFEANNTVYYVMEYVEGGSLDSYITEKKGLPEAECVRYAKQIGEALAYMHAHKMLHLDLKPGNVMLRQNNEVVLIDFGLSKQYDENGEPESSTSVGSGTPGYAPLEQANYYESKGFPVTMDVYALGATLFKMLTGVRPPKASDILNDGFPAYELHKHGINDSLIASVAKAMAFRKNDRPQSVNSFLQELIVYKDNPQNDIIHEETDIKAVIEADVKGKKLPDDKPVPNFWDKYKKYFIGISVCALIVYVSMLIYSAPDLPTPPPTITVPTDTVPVAVDTTAAVETVVSIPSSTPNNNIFVPDKKTDKPASKDTKEERFQKTLKLKGKNKEKALLQLANEGYVPAYLVLAEWYLERNEDALTDKWLRKAIKAEGSTQKSREIENTLRERGFYD